MLLFGLIQIVMSQIPDFHNMEWLSIVAAIMSFTYSFIGFGLGLAKVIGIALNFPSSVNLKTPDFTTNTTLRSVTTIYNRKKSCLSLEAIVVHPVAVY